jgi:5-methylcytosine-specific restriction endonuclease McrA
MPWAGKGSTRRWRTHRANVLDRDGHLCQLQLPGCTLHATQAHHTLGKNGPAGDDETYLLAACPHCNNLIGDPQQTTPPTATIHIDPTTL